MTRRPRAWRVVAGLIVVIAAVQLVVALLAARRPPAPPTLLANAAILADARAPAAGPRDADVTIYLLSDYACPGCRALHPALQAVLAADRRVRLVHRDWPVLGPRSVRAARLAIASAAQGRHAAFDDALMRREGGLDEAGLRAAAARAGVDWPRLEATLARDGAGIDALLDDTARHAAALGLAGTPMLVVGPYLVAGRQSPERLRELIAAARVAKAG